MTNTLDKLRAHRGGPIRSGILCGLVILLALVLAAPAASEMERGGTYEGTLTLVNLTDRAISVEKAPVTRDFQVDKNAIITTLDKKPNATLADLRTGYTVSVIYSEGGGTAVANSITELKAPTQR